MSDNVIVKINRKGYTLDNIYFLYRYITTLEKIDEKTEYRIKLLKQFNFLKNCKPRITNYFYIISEYYIKMDEYVTLKQKKIKNSAQPAPVIMYTFDEFLEWCSENLSYVVNEEIIQRKFETIKTANYNIHYIYSVFNDLDIKGDDGKLSFQEFCLFINKNFKNIDQKTIKHIFIELDDDNTGGISFSEFFSWLNL